MKVEKNISIFVTWLLLLFFLVGLGKLLIVTSAEAQQFSPLSDFQYMSLEEIKTLQVKLTYVGKQGKVLITVAFTSPFNVLDLTKFIPFRRPGVHYGNDDIAVNTCNASPDELAAMIQNISILPAVTSGGVAADPFLSFAMYNSIASDDKAFEAILNPIDTKDLFEQIRLALQVNQDCLDALAGQWRAMGFGIGHLNPDTDGDGLSDVTESNRGTDPLNSDTDADGKTDGAEVESGTDPLNPLNL